MTGALPTGPTAGAWYLAGLASAILLGLVLSAWVWPLGHCWCCKGTGRHYREDRRVFRLCRWCKGTGRRVRVLRRAYRFLRGRRG